MAQEKNSTCSTGAASDERVCTDVPTGGISYTSDVSKVTVNDAGAGQITLNTIGILLKQTGAEGAAASSVQVLNKIYNDGGTPGDDDDDIADDYYELADASGNLVQDDNGHNIRVVNDTLTDASGTALALSDLDNYIASITGGGDAIASGNVTVINSDSFQSSGTDGIGAAGLGEREVRGAQSTSSS